jgi:enamine deaminase RidA (YjgF/YER057c/UK114 family)
MKIDVRALEQGGAGEFYIRATSDGLASPAAEARQIFAAIAATLREQRAWICQERIFAPAPDVAAVRRIRAEVFGDIEDAMEATVLAAEDAPGIMPGVQVYAVRTATRPRIVSDGDARARVFHRDGCSWLSANGLRAPEAGDGPAQARAIFEKAERLLAQVGGDLQAVARTWVFMDDVLAWYGQFNKARSGLFVERGLLGPQAAGRLPASTGIGISPADGSRCTIDLFAVIGPRGAVKRYEAAGKQRSANEYGSAFARAAIARTPAGHGVYVSGTAAIDAAGTTCCRDDITGQIAMTLENVEAVLDDLAVDDRDVVQAMAYCVSPEVQKVFRDRFTGRVPWPCLVMIGDVCRDDLLFEVEVTACPGAERIGSGRAEAGQNPALVPEPR